MTKKTSKNTTKTDKNDIVVSFEGVKTKDFRAYWDAVRRGDWKGQDAFFTRVVKSWPYDFDPADVASYGELSFDEYAGVQGAINKTVVRVFEELARANVLVKAGLPDNSIPTR